MQQAVFGKGYSSAKRKGADGVKVTTVKLSTVCQVN